MSKKKNAEAKVEELLDKLGILCTLNAYEYIKRAVTLYMESPVEKFSNKIFSTIDKEYNVESGSVRKAINRAVRFCWKCYSSEKIEETFGKNLPTGGKVPTNAEFIIMCAECVEANL